MRPIAFLSFLPWLLSLRENILLPRGKDLVSLEVKNCRRLCLSLSAQIPIVVVDLQATRPASVQTSGVGKGPSEERQGLHSSTHAPCETQT
ncbi:uncharacterized protein K489DRAFT_379429 [Dissoconium aciculare CBS 342.82]|uniref:Secreted protein n=1 Tax=Dissoconium aciculare CBS 342.82 TaxID=1314786 RepID=A0A6J3M6A3_9PEZI|nr:uncharacterized protein K489DRAFT_379429 [Dissoconium aciculare CBS 342.82]KAF1823428.1 hypothetical protein K489DRAFT_379429 [Dissoconium aciculare CBS 342.82]